MPGGPQVDQTPAIFSSNTDRIVGRLNELISQEKNLVAAIKDANEQITKSSSQAQRAAWGSVIAAALNVVIAGITALVAVFAYLKMP
jgi:hypothetical protein